jgi:hypothetical protein
MGIAQEVKHYQLQFCDATPNKADVKRVQVANYPYKQFW